MGTSFKDSVGLRMTNMLLYEFKMYREAVREITSTALMPWRAVYEEKNGERKITVHCSQAYGHPTYILSIKYIMLTLLFYPELMGQKPRIIIADHGKQPRFAYLEDDSLWEYFCLTFWDKYSYAGYLNEDLMKSIMSDVIKYFTPERFTEILQDIHPDYIKILFGDKNDRAQYIEDSKVNLENRMILIRFLNEHFGESDLDQMRL